MKEKNMKTKNIRKFTDVKRQMESMKDMRKQKLKMVKMN